MVSLAEAGLTNDHDASGPMTIKKAGKAKILLQLGKSPTSQRNIVWQSAGNRKQWKPALAKVIGGMFFAQLCLGSTS